MVTADKCCAGEPQFGHCRPLHANLVFVLAVVVVIVRRDAREAQTLPVSHFYL